MRFFSNLSPRVRKILRYVGIGFFAVVVFIFAFQLSFPYNRVKDRVVDALSDKYDVTIGDVERGFIPGRVYFNDVNIRTRPTKPGDPVTTMLIKRLEVDVGILPLLHGTLRVYVDAKIGTGDLDATVWLPRFGKKGVRFDIEGKDLPGTGLPMRAVIGLPMTGKIDFSASLDLPNDVPKVGKPTPNWKAAAGEFSLSCPSGCTFGDGKTKLKPLVKNAGQQAMVGEGIDFGEVNIDSLYAKAEIKKGKLDVTKFDAKSKDGELYVEYSMTLDKVFGNSVVAGCLRFKGSDALLKREPKTYAAIQTTGAERRADGLFHIRLTDRFSMMKRLNQECGPNVKINNGENFNSGPTAPPHLTVMPPEPPKPPPPAAPAINAPTPQIPIDAATATPPGTPGSGTGGANPAAPARPESEGSAASGAVPPGEQPENGEAAGGQPAGEPSRLHRTAPMRVRLQH
jgi:type II secretion system protein N